MLGVGGTYGGGSGGSGGWNLHSAGKDGVLGMIRGLVGGTGS